MTTSPAVGSAPVNRFSLSPDEIWNMAVDTDLICPYYGDQYFTYGRWQRDVMEDICGSIVGKTVLDIGCGGLRFGAFILPEIGNGHYYGIDPYHKFLAFGQKLVDRLDCTDKATLIQSNQFEFPTDIQVDFAMSQSVFTHMSEAQILDCLEKLRPLMKRGGKFVFTYLVTKIPDGHHDGKLYQEEMPVVCAYLAGPKIFRDFAEKYNLKLEEGYTKIPHPSKQHTAILTF
jgi:cyclopropane fatty-acyl-phospholipid synthase-like methyltransferase